MQNKFEDRLVNVNDVIEAVDKHTREDETLDEDISVILEEVKTAFDKEKVIRELKELKMMYFLTIANTGDEKMDFAYEKVGNALDKAIEIVEKGGIE